VGGAEERRKGLSNLIPVKVTFRSTLMTASRHPEMGDGAA
jgi:hypothetical protein